MSGKILKRPRVRALAAALAAGIAVASCAYPTPYQPAGTASDRNGYSDQQIENDRFQVNFAGNSLTSRETVERYLLYRSAELTLQKGFDHFILVSRDTETRTTTTVDRSWGNPGPWGYWRPSWRWYRPRYGWRSWDPFYDDPFMRDFDVRTINQYQATAEIVVGRGPKPGSNVRAFDAREVIDRLGPSIELPKAR
ncbi:hypothetical protein P1X14_19075 [Sphingomonas sp. AOB5]|uniref:CC0125/CC1285 family lipoprotein n=1 Tax=Sphingomonas sp. AOB5 TaxID=3034017 RepID=UPI0023FA0AB4|nr:hypothetical protein [Sphingomonas sp. AOB5]MDF7777368.1 hypothetical protein [Sphingomonas sp. AOB5]